MSDEYAICKQMTPVPLDGSPYVECWAEPVYISPEQAALGAMTDGEVATILIRRKRHEDHDRNFAESENNLAMKVVEELGLWLPEVTE